MNRETAPFQQARGHTLSQPNGTRETQGQQGTFAKNAKKKKLQVFYKVMAGKFPCHDLVKYLKFFFLRILCECALLPLRLSCPIRLGECVTPCLLKGGRLSIHSHSPSLLSLLSSVQKHVCLLPFLFRLFVFSTIPIPFRTLIETCLDIRICPAQPRGPSLAC